MSKSLERSHFSHICFLSAETVLRGMLRVTIPLCLEGDFYGTLDSTNDLVIGEKAHVEAEVSAGQVVLAGCFQGTMVLRERLEITSTGRFQGKLIQSTPALIVAEGGLFAGDIVDEKGNPFISTPMTQEPATGAAPAPGAESGPDKDIVSLYDIET